VIKYRILLPLIFLLLNFEPAGFELEYDPSLELYMEESEIYEDVDLKGMIVPHHNVPLDKITKMYRTASNEAKTIILLSPDHFSTSDREMLVSKKSWYGEFGELRTDKKLIEQLLTLDFIYEDDDEIVKEHGLNIHIPFISRYFENVRVVPIAVNKSIQKHQLDELLTVIPEDVFIIASVDFSHYYPKKEADQFDKHTMKLFEIEAYDEFFKLNDAYFDTPGVLYLVFSWANNYKIYDRANSADYIGDHVMESTSYFFIGLE